jgi:hypothetical protein
MLKQSRSSMRVVALSAAALVAAAAVACGGGDETTTTVRTVASGSPAPSVNTGSPALDATLSAALAHDYIELAGLTGYEVQPCVAAPQGAGGPPLCREAETEGTQVEVFPLTECELGWIRPEPLPDQYARLLNGDSKILAVYRPKPIPQVFGGDAVAVVQTAPDKRVALSFQGGRLIAIETECAAGEPNQLLGADRVDAFIIAPDATPAQ